MQDRQSRTQRLEDSIPLSRIEMFLAGMVGGALLFMAALALFTAGSIYADPCGGAI